MTGAIDINRPEAKDPTSEPASIEWPAVTIQLPVSIDSAKRTVVEATLRAVGGNKTHAAKALGVDRRTLYRTLERLKIDIYDSAHARSDKFPVVITDEKRAACVARLEEAERQIDRIGEEDESSALKSAVGELADIVRDLIGAAG